MSAAPAAAPEPGGHMTIWEHIAELRSRLIKTIVAVLIGAVAGWFLFPWVFEQLRAPLEDLLVRADRPGAIIASSPLQPFATRLKVSAYVGVMLAMPIIVWQVWRFVTPGLYPHEKKYAVPFTVSAMVLFVAGASLAYVTLNPALEFLMDVAGQDIEPLYTVDSYVTLILWMMIAFGIGFEFPVLLVALQLIGMVRPRTLLRWWRHAAVLVTVMAAVITPSGDPITMLALAIPMMVLYFAAIGIGSLVLRLRRRRSDRAEGTAARS